MNPILSFSLIFFLVAGELSTGGSATGNRPPGARMPYTRYESEAAWRGGGAILQESPYFIQSETASEASDQKYVSLPSKGAYIEWRVGALAQGVNIRFTLPDSKDGRGLSDSLHLYVNGVKVETVVLSSYWAYQYFRTAVSDPYPVPPGQTVSSATPPGYKVFMRFDEVFFRLDKSLQRGDRIRLEKDGDDGTPIGVDFIELEPLPPPVARPVGSLSVTDFGAGGDDAIDDLPAFNNCIRAAVDQGKTVYIPPGRFLLGDRLVLKASSLIIRGAGSWYTQLYFSTDRQDYGGIDARLGKAEISGFSLNTASHARLKYDELGARMPSSPYKQYKGFMGTYGTGSYIHDIRVEHFECGFWIAGYDPPYPVDITRHLVIADCRIRNNYADGVNFCRGTSNSAVENCSIRNNGDDGMAVWPAGNGGFPQSCINDTFRYNTVENNWRAASAAIFGGYGHQIDHNILKDGVAGSGIRMTNDFPGFTFDSTQSLIHVNDNTIIACGTIADIWDEPKGAIELSATTGIYNVSFRDNTILHSQREAIRVTGGKLSRVTFQHTLIDGKVVDGLPSLRTK